MGLSAWMVGHGIAAGAPGDVSVPIVFEDAATGLAVGGPTLTAEAGGISGAEPAVTMERPESGGYRLRGRPGRPVISVHAEGYQSMAAPVDLAAAAGAGQTICFRLPPLASSRDWAADRVQARTRPTGTLIVGWVGDEVGRPLGDVEVISGPSGVRTRTELDGSFELLVPVGVRARADGELETASLHFERAGYRSEVRESVEVWAGGDWTYRIRLWPGTGAWTQDERSMRRRAGKNAGGHRAGGGGGARAELVAVDSAASATSAATSVATADRENQLVQPASSGAGAGGGSGVAVRVPRTIRVLHTNAVIFETLENYCRHVLPAEWISSWGLYPGGSNALQAGAVALRTYAVGYVNQPASATYDICSTTACQVYNPTLSSSRTDLAVLQTAGYVMTDANGGIPRGLTEYSAENNQLGMSCGDGFTAPTGGCLADPVCAGEAEFGHGRGMCQWGTVKWATGLKFPGNNFSDTTRTNGQPRRDWVWIAEHYYPGLNLVAGQPLTLGDGVRSTVASLTVRRCAGNTISNGVNCASAGSVALGTTGVIVGGPEWVTRDGGGYMWWQVEWSTGLLGWVVESYLARVARPTPFALAPIPAMTVAEETTLRHAAKLASGPERAGLTAFEEFTSPLVNGAVFLRAPRFATATAGFLEVTPNASTVTGAFPADPGGRGGTRVLALNWNISSATNAWLRLTTHEAPVWPSPVIDLRRRLRFDVYASRAVRLGLGVRETTNAPGTAVGANGGTNGAVEWVGVTAVVQGQPQPVRTLPAGRWTTVIVEFPSEAVAADTGDGALSTASGLAALESLAIVPADGAGAYALFLDDWVVEPTSLRFALESGAPVGATLDARSGELTWTPTEAQGPSTQAVTIRITDTLRPAQTAAQSGTVVVREVNQAPQFSSGGTLHRHGGTTLRWTNAVADADWPANRLTFAPGDGAWPDGASLDLATGVLSWDLPEVAVETWRAAAVRVTDDGVPPLAATQTLAVRITPRPSVRLLWADAPRGGLALRWAALKGTTYRIQFAPAVDAAGWSEVGVMTAEADGEAAWSLPESPSPGFYRLHLRSDDGN